MIGRNFIYCRPDSEREAVSLHSRYTGEGKSVMYYGGGSEIISMCTAGSISPDVVIDIKNIPALKALGEADNIITLGAACTLEAIRSSGLFPLLGETVGRIADHTNQCRITLGGNLCGTIIYREASLPLLLSDASVRLCGPDGERTVILSEVFDGRMKLLPGELIISAQVESVYARTPHAHIKRTFSEKIGYPAVTVAAMHIDGGIRTAFSGICSAPVRSVKLEAALNDKSLTPEKRAENALAFLPGRALSDSEGSGTYRQHLMKLSLEEIIGMFESGE